MMFDSKSSDGDSNGNRERLINEVYSPVSNIAHGVNPKEKLRNVQHSTERTPGTFTAEFPQFSPPLSEVTYVIQERRDSTASHYSKATEEPFPLCAMIGFLFSWIPIIGLLTFAFNCRAPFGSSRRWYATAALTISFAVLIAGILLGTAYNWGRK